MFLVLYLLEMAGSGYLALKREGSFRRLMGFLALRSLVLMPWYMTGAASYHFAWWVSLPLEMLLVGLVLRRVRREMQYIGAAFALWQAAALLLAWWNYRHGSPPADVSLPLRAFLTSVVLFCLWKPGNTRLGFLVGYLFPMIHAWHWASSSVIATLTVISWMGAQAIWLSPSAAWPALDPAGSRPHARTGGVLRIVRGSGRRILRSAGSLLE